MREVGDLILVKNFDFYNFHPRAYADDDKRESLIASKSSKMVPFTYHYVRPFPTPPSGVKLISALTRIDK